MTTQKTRLVVTRKIRESFTVDGPASICVDQFDGRRRVRLGVTADRCVKILREEVADVDAPRRDDGKDADERGIFTLTGRRFFPFKPTPETISIEDIAHGLAGEYRWGNQSSRRYTVAEHSVAVSTRVGDDPELAMRGLLHDAPEAISGMHDCVGPMKSSVMLREPSGSLISLADLEERIACAVQRWAGLCYLPMPPEVAEADRREQAREYRDLFDDPVRNDGCAALPSLHGVVPYPEPIQVPWPDAMAERKFLRRFAELKAAINRRESAA